MSGRYLFVGLVCLAVSPTKQYDYGCYAVTALKYVGNADGIILDLYGYTGCQQLCYNKNNALMGITRQDSTYAKCYCGDTPKTSPTSGCTNVGENTCGNEICGGPNHISVYTVCEYKGRYGGHRYGCDDHCYCKDNTPCTSRTGMCPQGCAVDYYGAACEIKDTDECRYNSQPCERNQRCENTYGSYKCHDCQTGYGFDPTNKTNCVDVNECTTTARDACGPYQICNNTDGSFKCQDCPSGYHSSYDKTTCVDTNECVSEPPICGRFRRCNNTIGGYICHDCQPGYWTIPSDITRCVDINECAEHRDNCQHQCVNNFGSFTCLCNSGYERDVNASGGCKVSMVSEQVSSGHADKHKVNLIVVGVVVSVLIVAGVSLAAVFVIKHRNRSNGRGCSPGIVTDDPIYVNQATSDDIPMAGTKKTPTAVNTVHTKKNSPSSEPPTPDETYEKIRR